MMRGSDPVRVIIFTQAHTFSGKSGGEVRLIEIFKRLRDVETVVVTCGLGEAMYRAESLPARYVITTRETAIKSVALTYLRRILHGTLLACHSAVPSGTVLYSATDILTDTFPAFILRLRNKRTRWVVVVHHLYDNPFRRQGNGFMASLLGFVSQRASLLLAKHWADGVIVVNQLVRQRLQAMGFEDQRLHVIGNGVNLQRLDADGSAGPRYDAVFLGRFHQSKGLLDLVDIWECLRASGCDARLAVVGGGDDVLREQLEQRIRESGLGERIDVCGMLSDSEAFASVRASRVFVFPSHEEGFGLALAEAMACGLPGVVWDLPVYREVFQAGLMRVPEGDVRAFASAVQRLLHDPRLHDEMSRAARESALMYDFDVVAEREHRVLCPV